MVSRGAEASALRAGAAAVRAPRRCLPWGATASLWAGRRGLLTDWFCIA